MTTANFQHSLRFFQSLADNKRPDLAADNAAKDGRLRLAMEFYRRAYPSLSAKRAWQLAYRQWRAAS